MAQTEKRCIGCMSPVPQGRNQCGICGYPTDAENSPEYLAAGIMLSERYLVGRLLQYTGDAAVYLGYDIVLKTKIRIREFFPNTLCERAADGKLQIMFGCEKVYTEYLENFRAHARSLARLRELSAIDAVYDIFDSGRTAVTVSEYCEGESLETRLARSGGRMKWEEARPLFMPLMSTLTSMHSAGVYHLGICPQSLTIAADGKLHLNGFCIAQARRVGSDITPDLIPGYSAPEQYSFDGETGEVTDVYGLAATLFRTLTGNPPPEGSRRAKDCSDLLVSSETASALPDFVSAAMCQGMHPSPEKRPASIQAFRDRLSTAPAVAALFDDDKPAAVDGNTPKSHEKPRRSIALWIIIVSVLVILIFFSVLLFKLLPSLRGNGPESSSSFSTGEATASTTAGSTTRPKATETMYATSNVVNKNFYEMKTSNLTGNMKLQIEYKAFSNKPKGTILSQTPSAETPAPFETVIKVVISDGPENMDVPTYLDGWNAEHARLLLETMGYEVELVPVHSDSVEKGFVVSVEQAGKKLPAKSKIAIRVSDTELNTGEDVTPAF